MKNILIERIRCNSKEVIRKLIIFFDYLFWLLFDFSKFKIIRKNNIRRIVIIHSGAIGELLVTTPLLRALKEQLNANITFMVRKGRESVLMHNPCIDKFIYLGDNLKANTYSLRKGKYDLAVILWPGSLKVSFACLLAKIPHRIGCFKMVKEGPAFFFTRRRFPLRLKHAVQLNLDMIRLIGIDNKKPKLEFYFSKQDEIKVDRFLKKNKVKKFVIIHPGFGALKKRLWPLERYVEVADYLIKNYGVHVLITGSIEEKGLAKEISTGSRYKKKIMVVSGLFGINESGTLISKCSLLIAPDTGVIHIAAALDKRLIDLVARSSPIEWSPWMSKEKYRLIFHPSGFNRFEREYSELIGQKCMEKITSEEVIKAADELLNSEN